MLTDLQLRAIKPSDKPQKLYEGAGFYVYVSVTGTKTFRFDYTFLGKRKTLTIGKYPHMSLLDARDRANKARQSIASSVDPSEKKKTDKAAAVIRGGNIFQAMSEAWIKKESIAWVQEHLDHVKSRQDKYVLPHLGKRPLESISAPEILSVIKNISSNDIAHRALSDIKRIFSFAIASGVLTYNPARDLSDALPAVKKGNFAAITEPKILAEFLSSIPALNSTPQIKTALWMMPRVAVRPIEIRNARWVDIDLDDATWSYTPQKTRNSTQTELIVPLATQVVSKLRELYLVTGDDEFLFTGTQRSKCISESTLNSCMIRLGWSREDTSAHGFRATFRTIADEVLNFRVEFIEQQLGHMVKDMHGRAYNRTKHLKQRTHMMQVWADYLDALAAGQDTEQFKQVVH